MIPYPVVKYWNNHLFIKWYGRTIQVGIQINFLHAAQNSTFKNHPRVILRDKYHLYGIVLVHIIHKTALNTIKRLQVAGYRILKITETWNFRLTDCLTDHSRKPRGQTKQCVATILRHNNKLTNGMCLLGFRRVCALCALSFLLSSIRLLVFFIQRNHIEALIFCINTFFNQHYRRHKIS